MTHSEFLTIGVCAVLAWEMGKWTAKKIIWKTVKVKIPQGQMSMTVNRFGAKLDPQAELDKIVTSAGMHRVD